MIALHVVWALAYLAWDLARLSWLLLPRPLRFAVILALVAALIWWAVDTWASLAGEPARLGDVAGPTPLAGTSPKEHDERASL